MFYILNGQLSRYTSINLTTDRGLQYGDGLFETMLFTDGLVKHFEDHLERLRNGLLFFGFDLSELNPEKYLSEIKCLLTENNISGDARVKLMVWRKTGGFYNPSERTFNYSISVSSFNLTHLSTELPQLGVAEDFQIPKSPLGNFKTLNSLYYVYAARLREASGLDDLVLLNTSNEVAECTYSNIFWKKGEEYFTPSLETGCIAGIARKNWIKELKKEKKVIHEGLYSLNHLKEANSIWLCNSLGKKKVIKFSF